MGQSLSSFVVITAADFEVRVSCARHLGDFCGVCSNLHAVSPSSSSVSTRHFLAGSLSINDPVNLNIQGPHKLLDDFVRSYFDLEMCHDIKIHVKYNTVNVHLERP
jgi:hypothetical protein